VLDGESEDEDCEEVICVQDEVNQEESEQDIPVMLCVCTDDTSRSE